MSEESPIKTAEIVDDVMLRLKAMQDRIDAMTPEEKAERELQSEENRKRRLFMDIQALRYRWNAPERHLACQPKTEGPWFDKLMSISKAMRDNPGLIVGLIGGRGSGKTQMAVELMRGRTANLKTAFFTSAIEFFMAIKSTYDHDSQMNEEQVLNRYTSYSLLIVDEVGKRGATDWENNLLFEMLNRRYNKLKDTILIDNRTKAEFIETIGPSLASRMNEGGGIIECNWPSFRN